ncbi:hypothetical protein LPB67_18310 [Undibacterium sp. Jales W-56]|uniref:hypothetical protein n=1 Tax=Undibacterium sp. Jales W-56 TaxID=2897325 RepID=UPI0021D0F026|nr:hypothetical protein [Undibacterium sp. Jales W-56]MCU6435734.1 hypothetical protein [Undibacterium sp. Jales W-56]
MSVTTLNGLEQEWMVLQNNIEALERSCLWIKLSAFALFVVTAMFSFSAWMIAGLLASLCLQEAIVRTSQARLGIRIVRIESHLQSQDACGLSFQLHTEWQNDRPGWAGLLMDYLTQALRPTVAFPYAVLMAFSFALTWGPPPY